MSASGNSENVLKLELEETLHAEIYSQHFVKHGNLSRNLFKQNKYVFFPYINSAYCNIGNMKTSFIFNEFSVSFDIVEKCYVFIK